MPLWQIHKISGTVLDTVITAVNTYITDEFPAKKIEIIKFYKDGTDYIFLLGYFEQTATEAVP